MSPSHLPLDFATLFRKTLLTWSGQEQMSALLALPPFAPKYSNKIRPSSTPLLLEKRGRKTEGSNLVRWPAEGVHSKPNSFLACQIEGSADLRIGVTQIIAKNTHSQQEHGIYFARLQEKEVLIYPPRVPTCDGTFGHWNDGKLAQPDSTILWIDIFAEGAILHTCHTVQGRHFSGPCRFAFNPRLLLVIEAITEELQAETSLPSSAATSSEIVNALMRVLFLRIYRSLIEQKSHEVAGKDAAQIIEQGILSEQIDLSSSSSYILQRCCHFIQGRLGQNLTVEKIAQHGFVSPAKLNRLFRAEFNQSVMEYVIEQRLNTAKALLTNTTLPVYVISENVGLRSPIYFTRLFRDKTRQTPSEYRRHGVQSETAITKRLE